MKLLTHTAISFALLTVGFTTSGKEIFPEIPETKETVTIQLQSEWYDSIANYKELGKYVRLPHENSFQYLAIDPRIKYTPREWFSIELFGGLMYSKSNTYNSISNKNSFRDRFWFTSLGLGLSFHKKFQDFYLTVDLKGRAPLNRFENLTELNVTGDGAYHIEPGLWVIYALSPHFAYLFYNTSFRYRTNKLSSLSYHRAGGLIQSRYIETGFSANLFFPVIPDTYIQRPETRWNVLDKVNGGSYKFYSVNPSALSFTLWMNFKPTKNINLQLYGSLDTYGENYGKGHTIGLLASGKWSLKSTRSLFKKELKRFKKTEEEDSYDEADPDEEDADDRDYEDEDSEEEPDEEEAENKKPAINIEISDEINKL
ncbi:MAG: hypothetical protein OXB86_01310 [Bdellovibrionales bacterium]|nr:hypothetical protein [Bdellovibrionales bacterium]